MEVAIVRQIPQCGHLGPPTFAKNAKMGHPQFVLVQAKPSSYRPPAIRYLRYSIIYETPLVLGSAQ
jgi:hypothetical protein